MTGFARLHPHVQHAVVHDLGWRSLRPVQDETVQAVLDGCNAVVLAPTAGGKTEAALFPVLSRILSEQPPPVAALYVCPIRALLNNQEARVQRYARMVGLDAFKWHGDVSAAAKARFRRAPTHLLLITPESLEVLMISEKTDAQALFRGLGVVIVDEVHAFAGDDRGAHLVSLLERLSAFCGRDVQRIGLSATVGNPDEIGRWLQGSSARPYRRVDPPRAAGERDLRVEYVEDDEHAARTASALGRGKKSLVFVESRAQAEGIAAKMAGAGVEVFIHHSAVSREERELAERQFAEGRNTAIVCTSTMELGLDVGDLDQVLQIDAPGSVASLLQRMGRTGRRPGTRANATFLCRSPEALLRATALLRLLERGYVEDVRPPRATAHILAHQVLALALQEGGVSRHRVSSWVGRAAPFVDLTDDDVGAVVDTMVARDLLYEADGLLSLGKEGERRYGKKNFFELYAVFSAPTALRVLHQGAEVGSLDATFLRAAHEGSDAPVAFRLAGRAWQVTRVDWQRGTCEVRPADAGRLPSWLGQPTYLSWDLCREMKRTLAGPAGPAGALADAWLSREARVELAALRDDYEGLVDEGQAPLELRDDGILWHTFAGGAVNRLLAAALEEQGGGHWSAGNLALKTRELPCLADAADAIRRLAPVDWRRAAAGVAERAPRGTVSKFQPCLPPHLEARLLAERLVDEDGARRFLAGVRLRWDEARQHERWREAPTAYRVVDEARGWSWRVEAPEEPPDDAPQLAEAPAVRLIQAHTPFFAWFAPGVTPLVRALNAALRRAPALERPAKVDPQRMGTAADALLGWRLTGTLDATAGRVRQRWPQAAATLGAAAAHQPGASREERGAPPPRLLAALFVLVDLDHCHRNGTPAPPELEGLVSRLVGGAAPDEAFWREAAARVSEAERGHVVALAERLQAGLPNGEPVTYNPVLGAWGAIRACDGDVWVGDTLVEIKTGRAFDARDLRQLLVYALLHEIRRREPLNPAGGEVGVPADGIWARPLASAALLHGPTGRRLDLPVGWLVPALTGFDYEEALERFTDWLRGPHTLGRWRAPRGALETGA
jgi:ATP-dependent Lhr-like helicase